MQSLPLEAKIVMTQNRIREWHEHWDGMVYVNFSGGKDSTALKHIVDSMYDNVPSVFVNTGLEYPEIQKFVKDIKAGKYPCFNSNVEIVRPEIRFDEVLKRHGYPVVSKRVSACVSTAKRNPDSMRAKWLRGEEWTMFVAGGKWTYLIDSPFPISDQCCNVIKKKPTKKYAKETGRKPMTGQLASESISREKLWIKNGCNGFNLKEPISNPLSFWTEQDILHYIKMFNVPYCSVYGDIVIDEPAHADGIDGQINAIDYLGDYEPEDKLKTTGCNRTGCIFCMFGCHLEKEPNRFQRLKKTHPRQYEYCIGGGEMVDGKWQPSKEGLGLGKVLDYIGVKYE
ncbi:MAG: phosphoadenosine phosphosulfate reductase family protein [Kiritimatiellae bacterium]|nr:phosphoadenosine phosphosulfate reductase family protein [Kiritimatiellia bacterium]